LILDYFKDKIKKGVPGTKGKITPITPEMLNPNTKLYISSYTKSKKPKIVNMTSSPQTNEHN